MFLLQKYSESRSFRRILSNEDSTFFITPDIYHRLKDEYGEKNNINKILTDEIRDLKKKGNCHHKYVEGMNILVDKETGKWYKTYQNSLIGMGQKTGNSFKKLIEKIEIEEEDMF